MMMMAEGFNSPTIPFCSAVYLYNPVHSPNVLHLNKIFTKSNFRCSLSNSKPDSPLLHPTAEMPPTAFRNCDFDDHNYHNAFLNFPGNTVGVIGGVCANSTLDFLQKVVELSSQDGGQPLPFLVCNNSALDTKNSLKQTSIVENLRQHRVFLERSGARCIAMPCHNLEAWHDEISQGSCVPFLHIGQCVAKDLRRAKLKPVEAPVGDNVRIGLVTNDDARVIKYYKDILQSQGYEVIEPDKATVEHAVIPAVSSLKRNDVQGARELLRIAIQLVLIKGVSAVILASHEISRILPHDDPLLNKCINPVHSLARETVTWAKSFPFSKTQI